MKKLILSLVASAALSTCVLPVLAETTATPSAMGGSMPRPGTLPPPPHATSSAIVAAVLFYLGYVR